MAIYSKAPINMNNLPKPVRGRRKGTKNRSIEDRYVACKERAKRIGLAALAKHRSMREMYRTGCKEAKRTALSKVATRKAATKQRRSARYYARQFTKDPGAIAWAKAEGIRMD